MASQCINGCASQQSYLDLSQGFSHSQLSVCSLHPTCSQEPPQPLHFPPPPHAQTSQPLIHPAYATRNEVARLLTQVEGQEHVLVLHLDVPFIVGRHPRCDWVDSSPRTSAKHLRLFAHETDSKHVFVSCHDVSSSQLGFTWQGKRLKAGQSVILSEGDTVEIPGGSAVFEFCQTRKDPMPPMGSTSGEKGEGEGDDLGDHVASAARDYLTQSLDLPGGYRVHERILGTGSFAEVYLAWDGAKEVQVACKRQKIGDVTPRQLSKIKREVRILRRLDHRNVNGIFQDIEQGGTLYYFVPIVCGGDLFSHLHRSGALGEAKVLFILFQLLLALEHIHGEGVAHRDVKPENVLLVSAASEFPHVQLADFGMAFYDPTLTASQASGAAARDHYETKQPTALDRATYGTPSYSAPEVLRSVLTNEPVDPFKMDSWALGCLAFMCLVGCHPFDVGNLLMVDKIAVFAQEILLRQGLLAEEELRARGLWQDPNQLSEEGKDAQTVEEIRAQRRLTRAVFRGLSAAQLASLPNDDARNAVNGLLAVDPARRVGMSDALHSPWIAQYRPSLDLMYKARVLGDVEVGREARQGKFREGLLLDV